MKKLFTLFVIVALTISVFAQAPEKMSYQAVIRDAANTLVTNHAVGIRISILQGSATGTAVYVETQTPTTNANGLATIEIGGGTIVAGTFSAINWAAGPYYLKTETDPAGGTSYSIVGTLQLLSVPYALYSKTTGNNVFSNDLLINGLTVGRGNGSLSTNTTLGSQALYANTTGYKNTANGSQSLYSNTTGNGNTATGYGALYYNLGGNYNTATGYYALYFNATGNYNAANGCEALYLNTTGSNNYASGFEALANNVANSRSTAVGYKAMAFADSRTTGRETYNTAVGYEALKGSNTPANNTGTSNTAVGDQALFNNTTGYSNVAIGTAALYNNTARSYLVAIGDSAFKCVQNI